MSTNHRYVNGLKHVYLVVHPPSTFFSLQQIWNHFVSFKALFSFRLWTRKVSKGYKSMVLLIFRDFGTFCFAWNELLNVIFYETCNLYTMFSRITDNNMSMYPIRGTSAWCPIETPFYCLLTKMIVYHILLLPCNIYPESHRYKHANHHPFVEIFQ